MFESIKQWITWHLPVIMTRKKFFGKLNACNHDCQKLDDRINWMVIRCVIMDLEKLRKNTWDQDKITNIQNYLRDNFGADQ